LSSAISRWKDGEMIDLPACWLLHGRLTENDV
jgi:hypothetical protein